MGIWWRCELDCLLWLMQHSVHYVVGVGFEAIACGWVCVVLRGLWCWCLVGRFVWIVA